VARPVEHLASAEPGAAEGSVNLTAVGVLPILLVDDRPENLRTLEAVLEPLGTRCTAPPRGRKRFASAGARLRLILLDVRMPEPTDWRPRA